MRSVLESLGFEPEELDLMGECRRPKLAAVALVSWALPGPWLLFGPWLGHTDRVLDSLSVLLRL